MRRQQGGRQCEGGNQPVVGATRGSHRKALRGGRGAWRHRARLRLFLAGGGLRLFRSSLGLRLGAHGRHARVKGERLNLVPILTDARGGRGGLRRHADGAARKNGGAGWCGGRRRRLDDDVGGGRGCGRSIGRGRLGEPLGHGGRHFRRIDGQAFDFGVGRRGGFGLGGRFQFQGQLPAVKLRVDALDARLFDLRRNFLFGELALAYGCELFDGRRREGGRGKQKRIDCSGNRHWETHTRSAGPRSRTGFGRLHHDNGNSRRRRPRGGPSIVKKIDARKAPPRRARRA